MAWTQVKIGGNLVYLAIQCFSISLFGKNSKKVMWIFGGCRNVHILQNLERVIFFKNHPQESLKIAVVPRGIFILLNQRSPKFLEQSL